MRWFGESWGAPVNEDTPHAPTPVGEPCARCGERIEEGDRGVLIPGFVDVRYNPQSPMMREGQAADFPYDLRCWLASVIGDQMADEVLDEVALRDRER